MNYEEFTQLISEVNEFFFNNDGFALIPSNKKPNLLNIEDLSDFSLYVRLFDYDENNQIEYLLYNGSIDELSKLIATITTDVFQYERLITKLQKYNFTA